MTEKRHDCIFRRDRLPNAAPTSRALKAPVAGNKASGISEVAGIGMASVINQIAVRVVIAAVHAIASGKPWARMTNNFTKAAMGPAQVKRRVLPASVASILFTLR